MSENDLGLLRRAIALAQSARERGNHPFGALLADAQGNILLEAENTVLTERDITGHAELNLVREVAHHFSPEQLALCTLYASTEPCAMCAGAIHWANIGRLVYALSGTSLMAMIGADPSHLELPCREVFARSEQPIEVLGPLIEDEATVVQVGFWRQA
ncbi:MAG TPA: nucleoside deaminase [Roseiflexaceae bacterium]|nr:nucleoside deaminase [Roseiflexaceae bacterium]